MQTIRHHPLKHLPLKLKSNKVNRRIKFPFYHFLKIDRFIFSSKIDYKILERGHDISTIFLSKHRFREALFCFRRVMIHLDVRFMAEYIFSRCFGNRHALIHGDVADLARLGHFHFAYMRRPSMSK